MQLFSLNEKIWERFSKIFFIYPYPFSLHNKFFILEQSFYRLNPQNDLLSFLLSSIQEKRREVYNVTYFRERQSKVLKKY